MTRRLRKARRPSAAKPARKVKQRNHSAANHFEKLEDRLCLAWVGFFDGITLDLVQTFDDGDVVIDNSGLGGAWRATDNADSLTFVASSNVTVTMLDGTANQLNFNINGTHSGDVELHLGNGPRDIFFAGGIVPGIANVVGGDLLVTAGDGPQFINLAPIVAGPLGPVPFQSIGDSTFDLGDGFDTVYNNENFVIVGGDLDMTGVNLFRYTDFLFPVPLDADLDVGGDLRMDTSNEDTESFLLEGGTFHDPDTTVGMKSIIGGDFIFIGGENIDHINLNDTYIMGDVNIDLGLGTPFFGDPQNVTTTLTLPLILGGPTAQIDGNISISAGTSQLGNVINMQGEFFGDTVEFNGGDLVDDFTWSMISTPAEITASMGGGDDVWTMNVQAVFMDIDWGNDPGDTFINNIGQFGFDSDMTNFHWFDHLYTEGDNTMRLNQLIDTGDVVIDNDGGPFANSVDWRVWTAISGPASTTPAANLILTMLDNTNNNVEMDLFNPVIASITMNLGDGDRNVDFTGASNNPLRDINIFADQGVQNVEISVNAPLAVATLNVDLGAGFDMVDDDANNLIISEDLIFGGVNLFENDGLLSVARHAVINSSADTEDTVFGNNANMIVGGNFTYVGGVGRDELRLNGPGGTSIAGNVSIDLGSNNGIGTQSALLNSNLTTVGGFLTVNSTGSSGADVVAIDPAVPIGGDLNVNLGDGTNNATLVGVLGGSAVNYSGGDGIDTVIFGTTGNPADVSINLGPGDDTFTLLAGAAIQPDTLFVDFGGGADTFINNYGPFDFSAVLLGLNGFNHVYDLPTDTLSSTQVSASPNLTVDDNGAGGAFRFIDGGTQVVTPATNLRINMQNGSGTDLNVRLDSALVGNLTLNLGDGIRTLNLDGASNSIGGDLIITGGNDSQTVELAVNNALSVSGDATITLSRGDDSVDEDGNDISITGDLDFAGVNLFENNGTMTVGGNFTVDNRVDAGMSLFDDDATMTVAGDFTYHGGNGRDEVNLNGVLGGTSISGNVVINLGDNNTGGTQSVLLNVAGTSVGGTLDVTSTAGFNADSFIADAGASLGGDITIDLGNGTNSAVIVGVFGGATVRYTGGVATDNVSFGTTGNPADVNIKLGAGDDTFTLLAGADIDPTTLRVDFGGGDDNFVNNYGAFDFNANLLNWHGFNRFYKVATDFLNIVQVADTGDVTLDNNGTGGAIRLVNGFVTEMTPATDVRLNLLANSNTNVSVDYDSPHAGFTLLDLKKGDREVMFIGNSNQIGGFLRIEAGNGATTQNVHLAVNADLTVGEQLIVNLREGHDSIDDGANSIFVGTNMILRAVNTFVNDNTLNISGNFTMNTVFDNVSSVLDNNGIMTVGGNLNYLGGSGIDDLFLSGANVIGNANIDLGTSFISGSAQHADLTAGTSLGRLQVRGGSTIDGNHVVTDATTTVAGDVIVNFTSSASRNDVTLLGTYNGTYGTYRGGSGRDFVSFGATANNMRFVTRLASANDSFELKSGTSLLSSLLDFGLGNDMFIDEIGEPYPFPLTIINLP